MESGQLENLNEGQLRALLDEAVTYKTPKDREGKSSLFQNLLDEAEQDEFQFGRSSICGSSTSGKRGRNKRIQANSHGGSLQDLAVAGIGPDIRPLRPQVRQHRRSVQVSARSLHGGSLPANVDQQNFGVPENRLSFEDVGCRTKANTGARLNDYIAIVKCTNPLPLSESSSSDYGILRVSANNSDRVPTPPINTNVSSPLPIYTGYFDDDDGTEMDRIRHHKTPNFTSTLEITSMTGESSFNVVDTQHGCIPSPAISQPPPASMLESKPMQLGSYCSVQSVTGAGGLEFSRLSNSAIASQAPVSSTQLIVKNFHSTQSLHPQHDIDKKSYDENCNTVHNVNSIAGINQHVKKKKQKKFCKNETHTYSHCIDGYRGEETLADIIKFIESDADNVKQHGKNQKSNSVSISGKVSNKDSKMKDDDSEKNSKKRSMERKSKDVKLNSKVRANSMEELSRRKFDDITINSAKASLTLRKNKKSVSDKSDVSSAKPSERRSWCNDESDTYYKQETKSNDADDLSTSNLSQNSNSNIAPKNKKVKQSQAEVDLSILGYDSICSVETSDFQTVTKKKKLRKRHSPSDENRGRPNQLYNNNINVGKNVSGKRSTQERDAIYKRLGQGSRLSASSPPSDKSNDSNDDLDSVHSLPADASGERLQASYADMARAAPSVSPPPPPVPVSRPHNFPDLIESCNYYANDISVQEKHLDISIENTKNVYPKENSPEIDKCKLIKTNSSDICNPVENTINKSFTREQYPALESRQKLENKAILKSKIDNKSPSNCKHLNQLNEKLTEKKMIKSPPKYGKEVLYTEINSNSFNDDVTLPDNYTEFVKHNNINSSPLSNESFQSNKSSKYNNNKIIENSISKHPDVVLPLAELTLSNNNNRPAVIIMNEEINRACDNMYNVDGITFGFDINELLLNGEINTAQADDEPCTNGTVEDDICNPVSIAYDSNIEFPAINEKPCREYNEKNKNNNEDLKHSKKATRLSGKDGIKCVNKNSIASETIQLNNTGFNESDVNMQKEDDVQEGHIVEARVGGDKSLRYLTPSTTFKDTYNLDKIVNYVGLAWEDVIKSPGDKIRYFNKQQ